MSDYVCSNCGASACIDSRMGSVNHYLMCDCVSSKNSHWYNDGRGGYMVYLNDAHPVPASEFQGQRSSRSGSSSEIKQLREAIEELTRTIKGR